MKFDQKTELTKIQKKKIHDAALQYLAVPAGAIQLLCLLVAVLGGILILIWGTWWTAGKLLLSCVVIALVVQIVYQWFAREVKKQVNQRIEDIESGKARNPFSHQSALQERIDELLRGAGKDE